MNENARNLKIFDNDKYIASLFAPAAKRLQVQALFNFHYQISQIPLEVSEPMVGLIKFQWWRDCFEEIRAGKPSRPHPVLLGLKGSNVNYNQLELVINSYDALLENQTPRSLAELEEFINHTYLIIFEQLANILEITFAENTARAYAYTFLARKIKQNGANYAKLSIDPAQLIQKSAELLPEHNNVFDIITGHYNRSLTASRWKLLLKLAFSGAKLL